MSINLNKEKEISSKDKKRYDKDSLIRSFIAFKTTKLPNKEEIYEEFKNNFNYDGIKVFEELKNFIFYYQYVFEKK